MEYGSYTDEELRRVLNADDRDTDAIIEAAERFRTSAGAPELEQEYEAGYRAGQEDATCAFECPECGAEIQP